jgi:flagellar export protein FliJ
VKRAFTFRLARVARVREVFEEEARGEFTAALAELHAREARCEALRLELDQGLAAQARAQLAASLDVTALLARERSLSTLGVALTEARAEAAQARAAAEERRTIWQARRGERQALDELSKRHKVRHLTELARAENAESDEVATQRFSHPPG